MALQLYKFMKKRGFAETLETLAGFENNKAVQKVFFERFEKEQSYYNAFLRVRPILLKEGLIKFELDKNNDKVVCLSEKGKEVWEKIKEIEGMLGSD